MKVHPTVTWSVRLFVIFSAGLILVMTRSFGIKAPSAPTTPLPHPSVPFGAKEGMANEIEAMDLVPLPTSRSVVVPTLGSPIPDRQNVIWTASLQLAWDELTSELSELPPLAREPTLVRDLNQSRFPSDALSPGDVSSKIDRSPLGISIQSTIRLNIPWSYEFFDQPFPYTFQMASGESLDIATFGIRGQDANSHHPFRRQVAILWDESHEESYALDLCQYTSPYQVALIQMPKQNTLAECIDYHRRKIGSSGSPKPVELGLEDTLAVPKMRWRILQSFPQFADIQMAEGLNLQASSDVQFELNRTGALLTSRSKLDAVGGGPRHFDFVKPFLIVVSNRAKDVPVMVAWIDNDELLTPFP